MNSLTDFKAILKSRQGPPASRFSSDCSQQTVPATLERDDVAAAPAASLKSMTGPPSAPSTPPMSALQLSGTNIRPSRRFSESGDLSTARRQPDSASPLRRRRATDSGCVSSVMQAVVEKRGLRHLAPESDKVEPATVFPQPRSQGLQDRRRRHSTDGVTLMARSRLSWGSEHPGSHHVAGSSQRRNTFSVPETCSVPENRPLHYGKAGAEGEQMSKQNSISFLESSVLMLTSNLAEASRREARLQQSIEELQVAVKSKAASSSSKVQDLVRENEELRRQNRHISASLARKTKVIDSASAALPMVADKASLVENLGPLRNALNEMQICALLELLSLGMSPHDIHCLLLGQSETGADIYPCAQLAGQLQAAFRMAEEQEDAIGTVVDQQSAEKASPPRSPVTRALMAQLLKEQNIPELSNMGVSRTILAEVSLALMSGVDPWSIVNLLDGRVGRSSSLDITLAPELMGALRHSDPAEVGMHSPAAQVLAKLARRCSLSPMKSLRQYNQELEKTNIALGAQIEDLQTIVAKKQCKWTMEKPSPAIPAGLWRVESIGSTGLPSPSQPSPSSSSISIA